MGDPMNALHGRLRALRMRAEALSPLDMHQRMEAIRAEAERAGLAGLEELARHGAQLALLPGCRVRTGACLEHADDAMAATTAAEGQAVLAAIALRLH